jgi:hypothetical protein
MVSFHGWGLELEIDYPRVGKCASGELVVICDKYGERHQRDGASPSLWTPSPWGTEACPPHPLGNFSPDTWIGIWRNVAQVAAGQVRETTS